MIGLNCLLANFLFNVLSKNVLGIDENDVDDAYAFFLLMWSPRPNGVWESVVLVNADDYEIWFVYRLYSSQVIPVLWEDLTFHKPHWIGTHNDLEELDRPYWDTGPFDGRLVSAGPPDIQTPLVGLEHYDEITSRFPDYPSTEEEDERMLASQVWYFPHNVEARERALRLRTSTVHAEFELHRRYMRRYEIIWNVNDW